MNVTRARQIIYPRILRRFSLTNDLCKTPWWRDVSQYDHNLMPEKIDDSKKLRKEIKRKLKKEKRSLKMKEGN